MKQEKVILEPLRPQDRERFILDSRLAFKYGALEEFGLRDNRTDKDGG